MLIGMRPTQRLCHSSQVGATMIEVLVTVVILSIGLLGMAGLQVRALKNAHGAHYRAQAAQYAYDMADRMRANRTAARAGAYNLAMADAAPAGSGLADVDRAEWLAEVATLPDGDGSIAYDQTDQTLVIVVQWNDARAARGSDGNILATEAATAVLRFDTQL